MNNSEIVKHIYDKLAQGDAAAILSTFDQNIQFRLAEGHPYSPDNQTWHGPEAVTRNFFMRAGGEWQDWKVHIHELLETEDAVIVEGRYTGIYKPTGKNMDIQVCHVWRLHGGKVTSFHQYLDTGHLQEIMVKRRMAA